MNGDEKKRKLSDAVVFLRNIVSNRKAFKRHKVGTETRLSGRTRTTRQTTTAATTTTFGPFRFYSVFVSTLGSAPFLVLFVMFCKREPP